MSISASQEREFYDRHYAQFLERPDQELAYNLARFEADLDNPRHPAWERRRLYRAAWQRLSTLPLAGIRALDYGCGTGDWGLLLAEAGARVTFLELSPVAIQLCLRRAAASGFGAEGRACDASDLSCFDTGSFDLVFACAALHHTLKYPGAVEELARVVRPGGFLVITETWGGNPLLNALRRLGWRAGGQQAEQGEEVLFDAAALARLQPHFDLITAEYRNLLAMAKRLFRGRFDRTGVRLLLRTLEAADSVLLAAFPFLAPYCGEVVVVAKRRLPAGVPS